MGKNLGSEWQVVHADVSGATVDFATDDDCLALGIPTSEQVSRSRDFTYGN